MRRLILPFCPTLQLGQVTELTPELLTDRGIRGLILDLDNTLLPWHGTDFTPEVHGWVRQMQENGVRLCILSTTHRADRLAALGALLGALWVPGARKPRRVGYRCAMALMGL